MNALWAIFDGVWAYERQVSDPRITMHGNAFFNEIGPLTCALREEGNYVLNGVQHTCFQNQVWSLENDCLNIYTHERKLLHVFNVCSVAALPCQLIHTHVCGPDKYEVVVDVASSVHWGVMYRVTGPRKNYTSLTTYVPRATVII